jgi:hypothetical protein
MTDKEAPLDRRRIEQKIAALAWKDDDFRKKFLADPKKQFEERIGTKLPADLRMTAYQEDENHLHFVIPAKPKGDLGQLSDADLEKVAGGVDVVIGTIVTALVAGAAVGSVFGGKAIGEALGKDAKNW